MQLEELKQAFAQERAELEGSIAALKEKLADSALPTVDRPRIQSELHYHEIELEERLHDFRCTIWWIEEGEP